MRPLNVIIGPNGSGKSNVFEAIELMRSAPGDITIPIRNGGGVQNWLWKGETTPPVATINAVFDNPHGSGSMDLRYVLGFTEANQHFLITEELIENEKSHKNRDMPYLFYEFVNGHGVLNVKKEEGEEGERMVQRTLQHEDIDPTQSILSQRKDPDHYPELTYLGNTLPKIRLYREWSFGRYTPSRMPQKTDLPNEYLEPDASNLGLVLNKLERDPVVKQKILNALQVLYDGITGYYIQVEGGTVQVFFHEGKYTIPATRLSDGTLRYLCLLAILCHPTPPPLVCIEEPELGLHPDVLPTLAELMVEASERGQLIVTTHSDILVDAISDYPESVLVAEKVNGSSELRRLNAEELEPWLEKYRLGDLWTRGNIGGTRW